MGLDRHHLNRLEENEYYSHSFSLVWTVAAGHWVVLSTSRFADSFRRTLPYAFCMNASNGCCSLHYAVIRRLRLNLCGCACASMDTIEYNLFLIKSDPHYMNWNENEEKEVLNLTSACALTQGVGGVGCKNKLPWSRFRSHSKILSNGYQWFALRNPDKRKTQNPSERMFKRSSLSLRIEWFNKNNRHNHELDSIITLIRWSIRERSNGIIKIPRIRTYSVSWRWCH